MNYKMTPGEIGESLITVYKALVQMKAVEASGGYLAMPEANSKPVSTAKKKGARKGTNIDTVLQAIKAHPNGASISELKAETDFADAQVRNIISVALKRGLIKRVNRGVYGVE